MNVSPLFATSLWAKPHGGKLNPTLLSGFTNIPKSRRLAETCQSEGKWKLRIVLKPNSACIVCGHIFRKERPVLLIDCEDDTAPAFMCGHSDHEIQADGSPDAHVIGYGHLLQRDSTLAEFEFFETGYEYERSAVGDDWIMTEIGGATH